MTDIAPPRLALQAPALALAALVPMIARGGMQLANRAGLGGVSDRRLKAALDLPVLAQAPAEVTAGPVQTQVKALIGAGDWQGLCETIRGWDLARAATPHGQRKARLAAGAVLASVAPEIIAAQAAAAPADPVAATLAGLAAVRRGTDIDRASALLDRFEPAEWASPLLAEAQYRLCLALPEGTADLSAAHDDWADLDARDDAVWDSHAAILLARTSLASVAAAAARAEWQTERWLGKGGYALFLLPVMESAPALWDRIDPERLAAAVLDLARHRHKDQGAVNRIARDWHRLGIVAPGPWRALLRTSYRQLLEESLNTLIPAVWGVPDLTARRRIADAFTPELRAGARLRATPAGLTLCDRSAA